MSLEQFFEKDVWGSRVEVERRLRIQLAVAAFAYEFKDNPIVSDADFDKMCQQVDVSIDTGNSVMDNFFQKHFDPSTGQWIHKHPYITKISNLYETYYKR